MAPHSSSLAWEIPWMEEPGRLQSMGSLRVGHDWAASLSLFTFMHWRRKWQPSPVFLPGESQDGGDWWASIYGVAQSRTRLKRLSSSSSTSSSSNCVPGHYAKWHDFFHLIFTRPLWSRYSSYYTDEESSQLDFTQGSQYNVRVYDLNHCASCLLLRSVVCLPIFQFY